MREKNEYLLEFRRRVVEGIIVSAPVIVTFSKISTFVLNSMISDREISIFKSIVQHKFIYLRFPLLRFACKYLFLLLLIFIHNHLKCGKISSIFWIGRALTELSFIASVSYQRTHAIYQNEWRKRVCAIMYSIITLDVGISRNPV